MTTTVRSFGTAGDTSTLMLARADSALWYDTPAVAGIFGFPNDPSNGISQAQTQANVQAMILALKHGATGAGYGTGVTVANPAALPATGDHGQRYVVLADNSTGGGKAKWLDGQAVNIGGTLSGSPMAVWEFRYPVAGESGWGRVATSATAPTVVEKIFIVGQGYLNWSAGGDTLSTDYASYVNIRTAAAAAVTAEVTGAAAGSVIFVDLHAYMKARIQAGTDVDQTSGYNAARSWHVADSNIHHNPYGHMLVARAVFDALPTDWKTAARLGGIATLGDSQSDYSAGQGVDGFRCWPPQLGHLIDAA